jgi:hypothetical protein
MRRSEAGMTRRVQLLCAWGAPVSIIAFAVGWVGFAGFLPPLSPSDNAAVIADIFAERRTGIRFGAIIMMVGTMFWIPWAAVVAAQPRRTERDRGVLPQTQVGCAVAATAIVIIAMLIWVVAAFRPDRSPELIQTLSDLGFVISIMPFAVFCVWNVALGLAIFADDGPAPAYPRWSAYLCMWTALLYVPGGALAFFQTGPLAWNGAFAFFLPAIAFFIWLIVMTVLTLRSINRPPGADHEFSTIPTSRQVPA